MAGRAFAARSHMARGRAHSRPRGLPRLSEDKFGGASTRSVGKPASPAQPRGHDTLQAALANIPQPCGGDRRKAIFRSGLRQAWWRTVGMIPGVAGRIHGPWKYKLAGFASSTRSQSKDARCPQCCEVARTASTSTRTSPTSPRTCISTATKRRASFGCGPSVWRVILASEPQSYATSNV